MATKPKALLLRNPGSGGAAIDLNPALALLRQAGVETIAPPAAVPEDFGRHIERHRDAIDRVIVAGGDGTLNAAAPALIHHKLPLGILPLGTANDLARSLDIPADPLEACAVIAAGHRRPIDLGMANERYFFNVAHIGLGVQVARALSRPLKARWGALGYARGALDTLKHLRAFAVVVQCDDKTLRLRTIQIAVGNGCYYGGGMRVAENAAIDDQRLDFYSLKPQSRWRLMLKLLAVKTGRWGQSAGVDTLRAQTISVTTRRRRSVSADGELITETPVRFQIIPKAIHVFVPKANR